MNRYKILIFLTLALSPCHSQILQGDSVKISTGYPDLDLYYSQIEKNTHQELQDRRKHLLQTTPMETFIMEFVEKGFPAIIYDTVSLYSYFEPNHTIFSIPEQRDTLNHIYSYARKYKSESLKLMTDFFKARLVSNREGDYELKMEMFEELIRNSRRIKNPYLEVHTLTEMWFHSYYSERYTKSFIYAQRLGEALDKIEDSYPYKGLQNIWLGISYQKFKEYEKAYHYLHTGLKYRDTSHVLFAGNYLRAWDHLAMYHQLQGNLDSAAYYNRIKIASPESLVNYPVHLTFAIGNLGLIEMQKGNIDTAIAMLEGCLKHQVADNSDLEFMAKVHASLAECYLHKGNMIKVKSHIETGKKSIAQFYQVDFYNRIRDLYAVESKYYSKLGEYDKAALYLDSALLTTSLFEKHSGQHLVLLGEQELKEAEMQIKNQQIKRQKSRLSLYLVILIIILISMLVILQLYRKKIQAYKLLAEKAKQWATSDGLPSPVNMKSLINGEPSPEDKELAEKLHAYMQEYKPYKETNLTFDILSEKMRINKNKLSRAINRTEGSNFKQYLNEFRVREAIILMEDPKNAYISLDELMEMAGFSSRSSYYEIFKKITGLTPAQYWKNRKSELQK